MRVAIVHDYLTQRGGAERVVLALARAFPDAPVHTSFYDPAGTFPGFRDVDVRTLPLDRVPLLRRSHRAALPLLAPSFARLEVDADVVVCSSSGWAHGARVTGRKLVYCHSPAKWLYRRDGYLGARGGARRVALRALERRLRRWDKAAMAGADRCLVNSSMIAAEFARIYGRPAEVLPPPPLLDPAGEQRPVEGIDDGFVLCVSRLLPYKGVDAVVSAFALLPDERLVVVGSGPEERRVRASAGANVRLLGVVSDEELRWLYARSRALVSAAHEDFGLTPLEAAAFGKPAVVLRWGGFLDTVVEGETGVFFEQATADAVADAVARLDGIELDAERIERHAETFSLDAFVGRIREHVDALAPGAAPERC